MGRSRSIKPLDSDCEVLRGELSEVPVEEAVAIIGEERITGRLLLSQGFLLVFVYFEDGELVHVGSDNGCELEEVLEVFTWKWGNFVLEIGAEPVERTLRMGTADLVLHGMRHREGCASLNRFLPSSDAVLCLPASGHRAQGSVSLSGAEMRVLELVDSRRTYTEIVEESGLGVALTGHVLSRLLAAGLVTTNPPGLRRSVRDNAQMTVVRRRAVWRVALNSLNPLASLGTTAGSDADGLAPRVLEALESPRTVEELRNVVGCSEAQLQGAIEALVEAGLASVAVMRTPCDGLEPELA